MPTTSHRIRSSQVRNRRWKVWLPNAWHCLIPTAAVETGKKERNLLPRSNRLDRVCLALLLVAPICAQEGKPRLYRVDDNVYRGLQPTRQDMADLASHGIRTVLD